MRETQMVMYDILNRLDATCYLLPKVWKKVRIIALKVVYSHFLFIDLFS